jgi:hypothetical protein
MTTDIYRLDTREVLLQRVMSKLNKEVNDNQELFLAKIIKDNPDIDFMKYVICYQNAISLEGVMTTKWWTEKI